MKAGTATNKVSLPRQVLSKKDSPAVGLRNSILVELSRSEEGFTIGELCKKLFDGRVGFQDGERLNKEIKHLEKSGLIITENNLVKITEAGKQEVLRINGHIDYQANGGKVQPDEEGRNGVIERFAPELRIPSQVTLTPCPSANIDSSLPEGCNDILVALYRVYPKKKRFEDIANVLLTHQYKIPRKEFADYHFLVLNFTDKLISAGYIKEIEDPKGRTTYYAITKEGIRYIENWLRKVDKSTIPALHQRG